MNSSSSSAASSPQLSRRSSIELRPDAGRSSIHLEKKDQGDVPQRIRGQFSRRSGQTGNDRVKPGAVVAESSANTDDLSLNVPFPNKGPNKRHADLQAQIAKEATKWSRMFHDDRHPEFRERIKTFTVMRDRFRDEIKSKHLTEGEIRAGARRLAAALGFAYGLIQETGEFSDAAVKAFKAAQGEYVESSLKSTNVIYYPAAARTAIAAILGYFGLTGAVVGVNAVYLGYELYTVFCGGAWAGANSSECVAGQVMPPHAQLPAHSSTDVELDSGNPGTLRLVGDVKRDMRELAKFEAAIRDRRSPSEIRKMIDEDIGAVAAQIDKLRQSRQRDASKLTEGGQPPVRSESDIVVSLSFFKEDGAMLSRTESGELDTQKFMLELKPGERVKLKELQAQQAFLERIRAALPNSDGDPDSNVSLLNPDAPLYDPDHSPLADDLNAIRDELEMDLAIAGLWEQTNVSVHMGDARKNRALMSGAATGISAAAHIAKASWDMAESIAKPFVLGADLASAAVTLAVPIKYQHDAHANGWKDYQNKVMVQLAARALTGPGNFHLGRDADNDIDPTSLDKMMRGPLKTRMGHFADGLKFDNSVAALAIVTKLAGPGTVDLPDGKGTMIRTPRTPDRLFAAFSKCKTSQARAQFVATLMAEVNLSDGAKANLQTQIDDMLEHMQGVSDAEAAARSGKLSVVMESNYVTPEAKVILEGSLSCAATVVEGGVPSDEEQAADKALQRLKGFAERESRAQTQAQVAHKLGQQFAFIIAGSASPALIKSFSLVFEAGFKLNPHLESVADGVKGTFGLFIVVGQLINSVLVYSYHKNVSTKNIQKQRNKDADIADMPNAGFLWATNIDFLSPLSSPEKTQTKGFRTLASTPIPHIDVDQRVDFEPEIPLRNDAWEQMMAASFQFRKFFGYPFKEGGSIAHLPDLEAEMEAGIKFIEQQDIDRQKFIRELSRLDSRKRIEFDVNSFIEPAERKPEGDNHSGDEPKILRRGDLADEASELSYIPSRDEVNEAKSIIDNLELNV